jgi:flavin-dependent dehydrogenase
MERFDVAIVGAGPAGCRAAWRMARAGARVAMLDASHPREKPCGGGVTGRALDVVRDAIDCVPIDAVSIRAAAFEHGSRRVQVAFDEGLSGSPELVVASRARFDTAPRSSPSG